MRQQSSDALLGLHGLGKLAAIGQVASGGPSPRRLFQQLDLGQLHAAITKLAQPLRGPRRLAGVQKRFSIRQAALGQGLTKLSRGHVNHADLLGLFQVIPGASQIVMLQVPFAALHITLGDLPQHFPCPFVALSVGLTQQTVGLFQASVLVRLLCLPQSDPGKTQHSDKWLVVSG